MVSSFLHPLPSFSGGDFNSGVGGALLGVPFVGDGLAAGAKPGGVEADSSLGLALGRFAGV